MMSEGKLNSTNMRLKRSICDEDRVIFEEPSSKSQRFYDDQCSQGPYTDSQFDEHSEITEYNYKKISATTIFKKLQVLEIRDKIERSTFTQPMKEVNVENIKPMEGTCFDMCPEKERLFRINGNMISQFECKTINSKSEPVIEIMVKQYARSSADQVKPLSHELRPTSVLVKTMKYMLKNIIYPVESNIEQDLSSWYDFCWDRLRAIRKDIVQQNLQNAEVVTILEQIGRFHIACYDLMLGYTGFDIKLNTENLNNCIQMLMPMYRNSEQSCINEPEFVSYELLMYLGTPQFYTAYNLLPIQIKQSPQVRFCIKAHTTYLQSSNTIDFFDLLKSTTYMNCCLLQRIIPSIRYYNITMMNMSYTTAKRVYKLEIKHFMNKLCFDDVHLAQEFCSDIQLKCDDTHVELSRKILLSAPENELQKQELIIIQKRQNLTQMISGMQILPDVIINSVHTSFDSNNRFNDPTNIELDEDKDLNNEMSYSQMKIDNYCLPNSEDCISLINQKPLSTSEKSPIFEISTFTFKLPTQFQFPYFNFETPQKPLIPLSTNHDDSTSDQSNQSVGVVIPNNLTIPPQVICNQDLFIKPQSPSIPLSPIHSNTSQSPNIFDLTEIQINLAKKYFSIWQDYIIRKKSKYIEEVFNHEEWFHSECISSLSSSPSSVKSIKDDDLKDDVQENSNEWLYLQYFLAKKYFHIWLRNMLRRRRKIEINPVTSMPWGVFMQVHGTPKEILQNISLDTKLKRGTKGLKFPLWNQNTTKEEDFSDTLADLFVKNILDTKTSNSVIGKKIFWKLAVNYGDSLEPCIIQVKVQAIIYGKQGFRNNIVQCIHTDHNVCFIKSVQSNKGLQDWKNSGLNAAMIFTNTNKEDIETLFKRVESILNSTPTAVPLVLIFSSTSDRSKIEFYQSVLDAYHENDYINNYSVSVWEGPKTILDALEFFSKHYVDITPGMRSEKLYYNLLNFAQTFFLNVRKSLTEDNPNIIINKYNQCLDGYIKRLGKLNPVLRDCAPEFLAYYTQNPDEFSKEYSNLNLEYFEGLLNDAHLPPYKSWPPESVDDLIDYVKDTCRLTNRRCWCLDILQMLHLHRNTDLEDCLSNGNWYSAIEYWIQGALEKCTSTRNCFTVLYNGEPINDVIKIVFPGNQ